MTKNICTNGFKVSSHDQRAFEHYCIIPPSQWAQDALKGMINKAVKTILRDWLEKFKEQAEIVPTDKSLLIPLIVSMVGFKPYNETWKGLIKAKRKESNPKNIELWEDGFQIEEWEEIALNAYYGDYVQNLYDLMENKIACRKNAFQKEFEAKLLETQSVEFLPKHQDDLIDLVTNKEGYKNRAQREQEIS